MIPPIKQAGVFVSRTNRAMSVAAWATLAVLFITGVMVAGNARVVWLGVPVITLAGWVYFLLWSPNIQWDRQTIQVTNLFRVASVSWQSLIHIDTKYALTVHVPGGRVSALAAPAPSRLTVLRLTRQERRGPRLATGMVRVGDLIGTDSGDAAALLRDCWAVYQQGSHSHTVAVPPAAGDREDVHPPAGALQFRPRHSALAFATLSTLANAALLFVW